MHEVMYTVKQRMRPVIEVMTVRIIQENAGTVTAPEKNPPGFVVHYILLYSLL